MNVFEALSSAILARSKRPIVVGVSGVDGAGKTEFTKKLLTVMQQKGSKEVFSVSIDGFHNPRAVRYEKGRDSAEGFYRDSFNFKEFEANVLYPVTQGKRWFVPRIFDVKNDVAIEAEKVSISNDSILLVEGIFLFQPHLLPYFDMKLYLDVPFDLTLQRMLKRDSDSEIQGHEAVELFEKRYKAGQLLYLRECKPQDVADAVIDNSNYNEPRILKGLSEVKEVSV